jgi:hypothetical protein
MILGRLNHRDTETQRHREEEEERKEKREKRKERKVGRIDG